MLKYYLDKEGEKSFGYNFSLLMKLAAKKDPEIAKSGEIFMDLLVYPIFKNSVTEEGDLVVYFSDNEELRKYIRLSSTGNYYFGFRISIMQFIKTFVAKDKNQRSFSANKFIYSYMMKNYFKNYWNSTGKHYYFESRYKDHRKTHDELILIDKKRRNELFNTMSIFLRNKLSDEKEQYQMIRLFLKIKKVI